MTDRSGYEPDEFMLLSNDDLIDLSSISGRTDPDLDDVCTDDEADDFAATLAVTHQEGSPRAPADRRMRRPGFLKGLAVAASVLMFLTIGFAWGFKVWVDDHFTPADVVDAEAIADAGSPNHDENLLVVGADGADVGTVILVHIPRDRERVVLVSFLPNVEVNRPECEGWNPATRQYTSQQHPPAANVTIASAYEVGGPKCLVVVVQQLTGVVISRFVGIDFDGFKALIDAVDGVDVCVNKPLIDNELGEIVPQAGQTVTLTGDRALNFARAVHTEGDTPNEFDRIKRQQRLLSALFRKIVATEILLNPGKLVDLLEVFSESTFGANIDELFFLAQSLRRLPPDRVTFVTTPTTGTTNARGHEVFHADDNAALFAAIRTNTPMPGESAPTPSPSTTDPSTSDSPDSTTDPLRNLERINGADDSCV